MTLCVLTFFCFPDTLSLPLLSLPIFSVSLGCVFFSGLGNPSSVSPFGEVRGTRDRRKKCPSTGFGSGRVFVDGDLIREPPRFSPHSVDTVLDFTVPYRFYRSCEVGGGVSGRSHWISNPGGVCLKVVPPPPSTLKVWTWDLRKEPKRRGNTQTREKKRSLDPFNN